MIDKNIVIIKDNILQDIPKRKRKQFINKYLKEQIKGTDYYVDDIKIIANNVTIGKLRYGKTNFSKKIEISIREELKFNIIANFRDVILNSKIYQTNKIDTKGHNFANVFDRRKTICIYKKQRYEIMFEIGRKNNINTLYSIENIKKIGKLPTEHLIDETSKSIQ